MQLRYIFPLLNWIPFSNTRVLEIRHCNENALRIDGDIESLRKQKVAKFDSDFMTFHSNDKRKAIVINLSLTISN
jgi:hypothetical protein